MEQCHMYTAGERCPNPARLEYYMMADRYRTLWKVQVCHEHGNYYAAIGYKVREIKGVTTNG